jgi:hypothetical protein
VGLNSLNGINMDTSWNSSKTWVAYFDILGYKDLIEYDDQSLPLEILKSSIDDAIKKLKNDIKVFKNIIDYTSYADTFIIYSKAVEKSGYPALVRTSKNFLNTCVSKRLPIRGAISYGELVLGHDSKIMGKAFLESHEYGEDQNWIGLLLTPSASSQLKFMGLDPIRHGFINCDIPLRKYPIFDENVYAYRFINGSTNFECPLLPFLNEMLQKAQLKEKVKYINTIRFIGKYYTVHSS